MISFEELDYGLAIIGGLILLIIYILYTMDCKLNKILKELKK